jgi:hypothetical protein
LTRDYDIYKTRAMKLRTILFLGTLCSCLIAPTTKAAVTDLTIKGSTLGSFNGNPLASSATYLGLTYTNSTFDTTTSNGFAALGGNPNPPANFNNLGSFALNSSNNVYNGTFTLQVLFTDPTGIAGGNTAMYAANIFGSVTNTFDGGVFLNFDNTVQTFTFSNANGSGSFSLQVNDLSVNPGQVASVTGNILANIVPIPEVPAMAPLGLLLGAIGIGEVIRRRRGAAALA